MRSRIVAFTVVAIFCLTESLMLTSTADPVTPPKTDPVVLVLDGSSTVFVDSALTTYMSQLVAFSNAYNEYIWYSTEAEIQRQAEILKRVEAQRQVASSSVVRAPGDIWACIIQHESGGNPTAYNRSSGAAGIYQFELGTWLSSSIISITGSYPGGASTAPASVQTAAAIAYQAKNGWGAWRGDGCTPVG